jgi:sulfite reductase (NADPH) hemoprotein beta-component
VDKYGVDWFRTELEKRQGFKYEKAQPYEFKTRNDYYGWQKDYKHNWHFLHFVENGRVLDTENAKLKTAILEIAEGNLANFRFTANQNIIFTDISEANKGKVEHIFKKYNIHNNVSAIRKSAMACVAMNTCPLAMAEGQRYMPSLIDKIEPLLAKHGLEQEPISIRMTGCPNGCARPYMAEIGLIGKSYGKYNLYFGGSAIGERLNRLYKEDLDEAKILVELDRMFELYAAERKPQQSFGDFSNEVIN